MVTSRLRIDRIPRSLDEARTLVAYNRRIIATSQSPQRRHRAERMLANLQPHVAALEADAATTTGQVITSPALARRREHDEFDVVFDGSKHQSLIGDRDSRQRA